MKYIVYILLSLPVIMLGCADGVKKEETRTISVTINPQKYFLEQIVGDKFNVNCIVPTGSNPESFDPAPSQMVALSKSEAFFKVGYLGIENTLLEKARQNNPNLKLIDCSEGIVPMDGNLHEDCGHDHGDEQHQHHHHHHHDVHIGHAGGDPHIWSSPLTARTMVENMYLAVSEIDSVNKDFYKINYEKLMSEINHTDSIISGLIAKAPSKSFIIYHPALSYFAHEYGLTQYSIEHEGKNPSPSQLRQLIDMAKAEGVKVVFIQQEFDTKNAQTVADAIGGKAMVIDLMSYDWHGEMIKIARALALENE